MIRDLVKRTAKLGVAVAKFAANEVRERVDKRSAAPSATMPANPDHAAVASGPAYEDVKPAPAINVKKVAKLLENDETVLLDCREDYEWEAGYISPSTHIPMDELPKRVDELDKARPVVVYCLHGIRSAEVATWLKHVQGFEKVSSLDGGIVAWYAEYDQERIVVVRNEDH